MTKRLFSVSLILFFILATIVAIAFTFTPNKAYAEDTYTITWVNGDETIKVDTDIDAGATPIYTGATPTKAADAQYTYEFSGWLPEPYAANKDETYVAQFTPTIRTYTITWKNGDDTLETDNNVAYGETPSYDGDEPEKAATFSKTYTFSGWDPNVSTVVGDQIYQAQFDDEDIIYVITWVDYDEEVLAELENVTYDTEYPYTTPQRAEDIGHTYAFNNWSETVNPANYRITRTATYNSTPKLYKAIYQDWDGTELYTIDSDTAYDSIEYVGATPERAADAQYTYAFNNWSEELQEDTLVYTAVYSTTINTYTIIWKNGDTTLETDLDVEYGTTPSYNGQTPQKDTEGGYDYTFTGWSPEVSVVVGNQTYTAVFTPSAAQYTLTYGDGEQDHMTVTYGEPYTIPVQTQEGKWLNRWEYSSTILAYHDGVSLAPYEYTTDIEVTAIWEDFVITVDTTYESYEQSGDTEYQLTVTAPGEVVFASSNENAFTVSNTGLVKRVGKGRAVITVTQKDYTTHVSSTFLSVDKIVTDIDYILNVTINTGINDQKYMILCNNASTIGYVSDAVLQYLSIGNDYIDRTDLGVELDVDSKVGDIFQDSGTLNINLIYSILKAKNDAVSYSLSNVIAEYNTKVFIVDLVAVGDNVLGNIIAQDSNGAPITVTQGEKSFIVPASNVTTDVLLKEVPVSSSTIRKVEIKSKEGLPAGVKVTVDTKQTYNQAINIGSKAAAAIINVSFKKGDVELDSVGEYTLTLTVPEEIVGKDGVEVYYLKDGEVYVKQVFFEGKEVTITLTGVGDVVFAANVHESTTYLYWLIILLLFLDAFCGMIVVILATNYSDALARRKALNGYSVVLTPIFALGAVVAAEIAVVAFLGLVLVIELTAIGWFSLRLTNKYFMYTTYHKLYRPKYDEEDYK